MGPSRCSQLLPLQLLLLAYCCCFVLLLPVITVCGGDLAIATRLVRAQNTVWSLVHRTRSHAKYGDSYGRFPSFLKGWKRTDR